MDIGKLAWDVFVKAVLTQLLTAVPWLAGPLAGIVSLIVIKLGEWIWARTGAMYVIKFREEAKQREFEAVSVKLAILYREKGEASEEFKKARAEHVAAFAKYVAFS